MKSSITIFDENKNFVTMFPAPPNKYVARQLWVFLVDNLQPGFIVQLGSQFSEITRPSARKVTPELYKSLMDGSDLQEPAL